MTENCIKISLFGGNKNSSFALKKTTFQPTKVCRKLAHRGSFNQNKKNRFFGEKKSEKVERKKAEKTIFFAGNRF